MRSILNKEEELRAQKARRRIGEVMMYSYHRIAGRKIMMYKYVVRGTRKARVNVCLL